MRSIFYSSQQDVHGSITLDFVKWLQAYLKASMKIKGVTFSLLVGWSKG